jgi:hypothetical protein
VLRPEHFVGRVGFAGEGKLRLRCRGLGGTAGEKTLSVLLDRGCWCFLVLVLVGVGDCLRDDAVLGRRGRSRLLCGIRVSLCCVTTTMTA